MLIKAKFLQWSSLKAAVQFGSQSAELSAESKKKLDLIAQHLIRLNLVELKYFQRLMKESKGYKLEDEITEEWVESQKRIEELWPRGLQSISYVLNENLSGSAGNVASSGPVQEQKTESEAKEAPVQEKTSFDLELSSFEASGKLKIIKELRGVLNLGLKEAKELVEKAPVSISKNVAKEEAEKLKEKLEALGCKITLL